VRQRDRLKGLPRQLSYADPRGKPVVVKEHSHPIGSRPNIRFKNLRPRIKRGAKSEERIFIDLERQTTMRENAGEGP
jgi:hypothetical protein